MHLWAAGYTYEVFTAGGTWDWSAAGSPGTVDLLLVGAGGSGGKHSTGGGGGGAGQVREVTALAVSADVTVTIGVGGAELTANGSGANSRQSTRRPTAISGRNCPRDGESS